MVELLLVLTISVILIASAAPIYTGLVSSSQISARTSELLQALRITQLEARTNTNESRHGIRFIPGSPDRYTVFQGNSYVSRNTQYDRTIELDEAVALTTTIPGSEVVFATGTGYPNTTGTITLTHQVDGTRILTVDGYGVMAEN